MKKIITTMSLLLNLFLCIIIIYQNRSRLLPKEKIKVAFWGDSLTANADWDNLLGRHDILNAGVGGFTTSHLLFNVHREILNFKPDSCYLMVGVDDLRIGIPAKRTRENYTAIVDTLLKYKITPIVESVLYTRDRKLNDRVDTLNNFIRNLTNKKMVKFLDVNARLSSNHLLISQYSLDGIHINEYGYEKWAELIK